MAKVRNAELDNLCEDIGEARELINRGRADEGDAVDRALKVMRESKVHTYKHAGVELARVPGGDEKLRVRLTKDTGDAEISDAPTDVTDKENDVDELEADEVPF